MSDARTSKSCAHRSHLRSTRSPIGIVFPTYLSWIARLYPMYLTIARSNCSDYCSHLPHFAGVHKSLRGSASRSNVTYEVGLCCSAEEEASGSSPLGIAPQINLKSRTAVPIGAAVLLSTAVITAVTRVRRVRFRPLGSLRTRAFEIKIRTLVLSSTAVASCVSEHRFLARVSAVNCSGTDSYRLVYQDHAQ